MMTLFAAPGEWARNAVDSGGYPALAGLILAENLFPPIPSEIILPVAGYFVGEGTMNPWLKFCLAEKHWRRAGSPGCR